MNYLPQDYFVALSMPLWIPSLLLRFLRSIHTFTRENLVNYDRVTVCVLSRTHDIQNIINKQYIALAMFPRYLKCSSWRFVFLHALHPQK